MKGRDVAFVQHSHLKPQSKEAFMCFTPSQDLLMFIIAGPRGNFLKTADY